jgi:hypothetical protein
MTTAFSATKKALVSLKIAEREIGKAMYEISLHHSSFGFGDRLAADLKDQIRAAQRFHGEAVYNTIKLPVK